MWMIPNAPAALMAKKRSVDVQSPRRAPSLRRPASRQVSAPENALRRAGAVSPRGDPVGDSRAALALCVVGRAARFAGARGRRLLHAADRQGSDDPYSLQFQMGDGRHRQPGDRQRAAARAAGDAGRDLRAVRLAAQLHAILHAGARRFVRVGRHARRAAHGQ